MANNRTIDLTVKAKDDGTKEVIDKVTRSSENLGKESQEAGDKMDDAFAPDSVKKLPGDVDKAAEATEKLKDKMEGLRNAGVKLAAIGAAALVISEKFTDAALSADTLGSKLAALLDGAGILEARGQVEDLAESLAKLIGGDYNEIARTLAESISSGRLMQLKTYGINISKLAQARITDAQSTSKQLGAQVALNEVLAAAGPALEQLRSNSSDAALALGEFDVRRQKVIEGIGIGSSQAKAALTAGLLNPILETLEANEKLQHSVGGFLQWGGMIGSAGGAVIGLTGQIGLSVLALQATGFSASGAYAKVFAGATRAAIATNSLTTATLGLKLGIAAVAIAAAAVTAGVVYGIGQRIGWIGKEITFVDSLKLGWLSVLDAINRTNNATQSRKDIDFEGQKTEIQGQYVKDRVAGQSEESAGKKRDAALLALSQKYAKEAVNMKDDTHAIKYQDQIDRLEQTTKPITVPVVPVVTAPVAAAAVPSAAAPIAAAASSGTGAGWIDTSKPSSTNATAQAAKVMGDNGGKPYSHINSDGSVSEFAGDGQQQSRTVKIQPKTQVSQNSAGNFLIKILPTEIVIPNPFGRAVEALG